MRRRYIVSLEGTDHSARGLGRSVRGSAPYRRRVATMLEIRPLGPQIGAEINGVDVKTLDDTTFNAIYRAWLDYNVVAVRGQELEIADFLQYSRRFGLIE